MSNAKRPARQEIVSATGTLIREVGYGALSTRRVAEKAGVPLSPIPYHLASFRGLLSALLEMEDAQLLERQSALFASGRSLAKKWALACDYLNIDMKSGYVRLAHEIIQEALADDDLGLEINKQIEDWKALLLGIAQQAINRHGSVGSFTAEEITFFDCAVLTRSRDVAVGQRKGICAGTFRVEKNW